MASSGVEQKPSKTALFAALHRALANKECKNDRLGPDYLAENFLPPHIRFLIRFKTIRAKVKNKLRAHLPGMHEYIIARTAFFDRVFMDALNEKIPQIVLLGAGYDTRAYRYEKMNTATKIIELDISSTQDRKKNCLKKAQIEIPKKVTLVPVDFNKESLKTVLEKTGYENQKQTLFLWEGVSYYLEPESVDATLELVNYSSHSESLIVFDYSISVPKDKISNYYGLKELAQAMKKHNPDEKIKFVMDEGKIESFLEQRGLKIVKHMDNEQIEDTFLLDENGSSIGKITGNFCFVLASPKG